MAEPDRTNADAERVSDIVAELRAWEVGLGSPLHRTYAVQGICEAAADIIEAQSKALAEARVARPLEWTKIDNANDDESEEAVTPFGGYVITADPFTYSPTTAYYVDGPDWFKAQCASVPEAKAAAQSDYETRVRSATGRQALPLPFGRDELGRVVREAWVRWAQTQPSPKASWLVPYDDLTEADKEADRQIGEAVAALSALTPTPEPSNG